MYLYLSLLCWDVSLSLLLHDKFLINIATLWGKHYDEIKQLYKHTGHQMDSIRLHDNYDVGAEVTDARNTKY